MKSIFFYKENGYHIPYRDVFMDNLQHDVRVSYYEECYFMFTHDLDITAFQLYVPAHEFLSYEDEQFETYVNENFVINEKTGKV